MQCKFAAVCSTGMASGVLTELIRKSSSSFAYRNGTRSGTDVFGRVSHRTRPNILVHYKKYTTQVQVSYRPVVSNLGYAETSYRARKIENKILYYDKQ
jgi:hypothetical protein